MSIWSRFIKALENSNGHSSEMTAEKRDPSRYAIVDVEVGTKDHKYMTSPRCRPPSRSGKQSAMK